jgi:hypothetical protein
MKFMLLTYLDEKRWAGLGEAEQQRLMAECDPHLRSLIDSGKFLGGAPLEPTSSAKTVSSRNGSRLVTDGPYAETREQLGGYTLIEAKDLEEAVEVAAGFIGASTLTKIEVRAVVEIEGIPAR